MKITMLVAAVAVAGAHGLVSKRVMSSEQPAAQTTQAAGMSELAKIATPGENHKHLEYFIGTWETTLKMWRGGPGSQPVSTAGTAEIDWILDKRFLQERLQGTLKGKYFESVSIMGYNNYRHLYERTEVSTIGTHMLTMRGVRHPVSGLFTLYGEMDEPSLKVVGRAVKFVIRIINENRFSYTTIDLHAGEEYRVIQVSYQRQ